MMDNEFRDPAMLGVVEAAASGGTIAPAGAPEEESGMKRNAEQPHEARAAQVTQMLQEVRADRTHWAPRFKLAHRDAAFALGGQWASGTSIYDEDRYVANITMRHVQQRTSGLYAKNPTFVAKRKQKLEYELWDGKSQSLQEAQLAVQNAMAAGPQGAALINPEYIALLGDVQRGMQKKAQLDRIAKTMELCMTHSVKNQVVSFKRSMKKLVRRVVTIGWGYIKIDYQRDFAKKPDTVAEIGAIQERLANIERLAKDLQDGEIDESMADAEKLRVSLAQLEAEEEVLTKEGLQLTFPSATSIIPDRRCKDLDGFLGAKRVSEEFRLTVDEIKEVYGVDVSRSYTAYNGDNRLQLKTQASTRPNVAAPSDGEPQKDECAVFDVYVPSDGLVYTVCDGYPDFLQEPKAPNVSLDRFYPWLALTFNDAESEKEIFPISDVTMIRPMQKQYNTAREALRRHRIAARPKTVVASGMLTEEDKTKLQAHPYNAVIELLGLQPGQKVEELLQAYKGPPIDPTLYDTSFVFEDILRITGAQEANLGGTGGATATESSIAESSRVSGVSSNADDLDDFLTDFARLTGQVLLKELSPEEAKRIAGPGAVWPQMSRQEIADEVELEILGGSSGRPNRDREVANMERLAPFLLQVPGLTPAWLARQFVGALDDKIDLEDAFVEGLPSITTLNAIMSAMGKVAGAPAAGGQTPNGGGASQGGDATTAPAQQGGQGASNAPMPPNASGAPMADSSAPTVSTAPGQGAF